MIFLLFSNFYTKTFLLFKNKNFFTASSQQHTVIGDAEVTNYKYMMTHTVVNDILDDDFARNYLQQMDLIHRPTAEHSIRVALMATDLAIEDNRTIDEIYIVAEGGLYHDAGKLSLPEDLLKKPTKPNADEWLLIRKHPIVGFMYLMSHEKKQPAYFAAGHHEFNKNPYPRMSNERRGTFRGERRDNSLRALLPYVVLADTFDAMSVRRPYNPEFTLEKISSDLQESYRGPESPLHLILSRLIN